ncbi:uncharacterized protein [Ptychodera flava]|uniref:uncharacterized protein n=1 Tax=Ptychodera flava TaxID=63121 RepID=UPI003969C02C
MLEETCLRVSVTSAIAELSLIALKYLQKEHHPLMLRSNMVQLQAQEHTQVLIGIVPGGGISYISKAWGGRASDKVITRQCGLLEDLDSGDGVMADRGFDIAADLTPLGVKLYMPAFKGSHRDQLTANEVVSTKRLAEVRIHVERAIGRLKQFHILDDVVPVTMKDTAEQIVTVCGYLTNFMPPLC